MHSNHESLRWAIGSGFAANSALDEKPTVLRAAIVAIVSGFLAGLSFATKQTMGLGATMFIPAAVLLCFLRLAGFRKAVTFFLFFVAGWAVSAGVLILWLSQLGVLHEFFTDVFLKGPAAKGANTGDFLRRDLVLAKILWLDVALGMITLALSWQVFKHSGISRQNARLDFLWSLLLMGNSCAAAVGTGARAS